jgi:hypothetical protein
MKAAVAMAMPATNSAARELRRNARCGATMRSIITFSRINPRPATIRLAAAADSSAGARVAVAHAIRNDGSVGIANRRTLAAFNWDGCTPAAAGAPV